MKKYWAYKWAKYLEQPGLKQAQKVLAKGSKLGSPKCCLGHLEYMLGTRFEQQTYPIKRWVVVGTEDACGVLTDDTRDKVGMFSEAGEALNDKVLYTDENGGEYRCLAEINDDAGLPLKAIAKIIRKHWKDL